LSLDNVILKQAIRFTFYTSIIK